jgi:ribosomal protein S18 acetylase RimI-like enzyme
MSKMQMRDAESADAENIARLVNAAFVPERFFIEGDRTDPEKVRGLLQKGRFVLAEDGGVLAACVYIELHGERGYFGLLAVDPERQRSGLGSQLVALAENDCRLAGCHFMDLTVVNLRTQLLTFYRRLGYVETGTQPFPEEQHAPRVPCHLISMSKLLA